MDPDGLLTGELPRRARDAVLRVLAEAHRRVLAPPSAAGVVLDVKQELAKGSHSRDLAEIFPAAFAAEEFASRSAAALDFRKAARRYRQFDPNTYPEFAGRYVVDSPAGMAGAAVVVTAGPDRLRAELSDGNVRELIPESSSGFPSGRRTMEERSSRSSATTPAA